MYDYFTFFLVNLFQTDHYLGLMFASGFLSATLLPGNSEVVFSAFASQLLLNAQSPELSKLWFVATLGNSLGSFTTYLAATLLPSPNFAKKSTKLTAWAVETTQKYGALSLLLSWLPLVGDLLCGVAGWLRLNRWQSLFFITCGKGCRYGILLHGVEKLLG